MNDEGGRKAVGRPGGYMGKKTLRGKCDVRLSAQEDLDLTRLAERNGVSRSEIMRKALKDFLRFNSESEE